MTSVARDLSPGNDTSDRPRQAIILCAGRAAKLQPYTDDVPTALIKIAGQPMVKHMMDALRRQGVEQFVICRGWQGSAFDEQLSQLGEGVTLVDCPKYTSTGMLESLRLAMPHLDEAGGFYVAYGDIIFRQKVASQLSECRGHASIVVNASLQGKTIDDLEVVTTVGDGVNRTVGRIGKGRCRNAQDVAGEFGGIAKFSPAGRNVAEAMLKRLYPQPGDIKGFAPPTRLPWWIEPAEKASICDMLQLMIEEGSFVAPAMVYGGWHEVNTPQDLTRVWGDTAMYLSEDDVRAQVAAMGACLLSEANDLKRPLPIVAKELNVGLPKLESLIRGHLDLSDALDILRKMSEVYPVPLNDLWLEADDTTNGVRLHKWIDSVASARVLDRNDKTGARTAYYDYRDCAMSRCGPFRPEWIQELRLVTSGDAMDPDVQMNTGHLMMQTSLFIGPVDFYWTDRHGVRQRQACNTGDSNFISSFVPHSFTLREEGQEGIIIAVTYGGRVRSAFTEFARIGALRIETLCGDKRDVVGMRSATLKRHLDAECMSEKFLSDAVASSLPEARVLELVSGQEGTMGEYEILAQALNIQVSELLERGLTEDEEVVVTTAEDAHKNARRTGTYVLAPLARTQHQPDLKTFDVEVLDSARPGDTLRCGLHTFIYHFGTDSVELTWPGHKVIMAPGDSAYISPLVEHSFSVPDADVGAPATEPKTTAAVKGRRLYFVRIPGHLTSETLSEFATYRAEGRERVGAETQQWYK